MNDASVVEVSRCRLVCCTLLDELVLALILKMMIGSLFKIVPNWRVLTLTARKYLAVFNFYQMYYECVE